MVGANNPGDPEHMKKLREKLRQIGDLTWDDLENVATSERTPEELEAISERLQRALDQIRASPKP